MTLSNILLILFSLTELILLAVVIVFFMRLKKSEALLTTIQSKQSEFVNKLHFNAQLEQELIQSFQKRQQELTQLDDQLDRKAKRLKKLITQADEYSRSPAFLRQIILAGHREGKSSQTMAKSTGLSVDEVDLILEQAE